MISCDGNSEKHDSKFVSEIDATNNNYDTQIEIENVQQQRLFNTSDHQAKEGSLASMKTRGKKRYINCRTVLWYVVFVGFMVNYTFRININIAIVKMVSTQRQSAATTKMQTSECIHEIPESIGKKTTAEVINSEKQATNCRFLRKMTGLFSSFSLIDSCSSNNDI